MEVFQLRPKPSGLDLDPRLPTFALAPFASIGSIIVSIGPWELGPPTSHYKKPSATLRFRRMLHLLSVARGFFSRAADVLGGATMNDLGAEKPTRLAEARNGGRFPVQHPAPLATSKPWLACGISRPQWYKLAASGRTPLPTARLGARRPVYLIAELRSWLEHGAPDRATWLSMRDRCLGTE
jgi:hypothetical protein